MNPFEKEASLVLQQLIKDCGIKKLFEAEFNDFVIFGQPPLTSIDEMITKYGHLLTNKELETLCKYKIDGIK